MRALAAVLIFALAAVAGSCKQPDPPPISAPWSDTFSRADVGGDYYATDATVYKVNGSELTVAAAYNHPLWLRKKMPANAVIELDLWSDSPAGDIKVEAWGDGETYAHDKGAYTSSGYVFIMGGWSNSKSELARGNEHGKDVAARTEPKVEIGHHYHWKIVRKGGHIDCMSAPFLSLDDPQPLTGKGHEYFAFNDWEAQLSFDNLTITPLP